MNYNLLNIHHSPQHPQFEKLQDNLRINIGKAPKSQKTEEESKLIGISQLVQPTKSHFPKLLKTCELEQKKNADSYGFDKTSDGR